MTECNMTIKMMEGCEDLVPKQLHNGDAEFDIMAREKSILAVGESKLIKTGIFMELPVGFEAQVRPRSGLAYKHMISVTNTPGTIDCDYRGEVGVLLINHGSDVFHIERGDRIAQMVINELPIVNITLTDKLSETVRGSGGFGSTGVK